jgi:hypothetical protein
LKTASTGPSPRSDDRVGRDRFEILVEDRLLLVRQSLEAAECRLEGLALEIEPELREPVPERVPPRVLAEHQLVRGLADRLRGHDLVGELVFEYAVLVDTRLVREGVRAHDRLVRLHRDPDDRRQQAARRIDLLGAHARVEACKDVRARLDRHHHLFHRGVAGALSDPVDRALDLPRSGANRGQAVRDGQTQIVVAVDREHRSIDARSVLPQVADQLGVLVGCRVPHRIGNVQRGGARRERGREHLHQVVPVGARRVLRRELDVFAVPARLPHGPIDLLENPLAAHAQLVLEVDVAGRDEGVDARLARALERLRAALDVGRAGACQPADRGLAQGLGDAGDGLEVPLARNREARFDHVDAELLELTRERQLLR